ncbi:hypothetical protein L249_1508 [Ophiocordyceps polyrhachis-furcata BCC 54312]|uniref:Uncharacterized protein n=1 Tax=Ophiocordyceps polyrhachis-furcata BCC 54312 TaxID=1330021 RepID=A0A367L423_9HYPO|nr:hypothetical protein L249_1508 [Ophiocordyceps polyrhachis-furcata BCC 54312]
MMMSNQGVDHVIEKKKTNHVIVVFNEVEADNELEVDFNVGRYDRYWYSASIAYSAPIDVTAALCRDQSGAMTAIGTARRSLPTVTQGVVAGLRPNWYNLFQAGYSGPLCISLAGGNGLPYKMLCKPLGGCHGLSRLS